MVKKVNITTTLPVRTVSPILNGNTEYKNLRMTTGDIYRCICMRAFVDEVLADGRVVSLNSSNYNRLNGPVPSEVVNVNVAHKDEPVEEIKPVTPPVDEEIIEDKVGDPDTEAVDIPETEDEDPEVEAPRDTEEVTETIATETDVQTEDTVAPVEDVKEDAPAEKKPVQQQQHSNKKKK